MKPNWHQPQEVPARIFVIPETPQGNLGSSHALTPALLAIPDKRQGFFRDDMLEARQDLPQPIPAL